MKAFKLSDEEKEYLLTSARQALRDSFSYTSTEPKIPAQYPELISNCGVFVSLHLHKKLRGCIGTFSQNTPLYILVRDIALSAAFNDSRFPSLREEELPMIHIEISVLTPLKKISGPSDIIPGQHGIYIRKGLYTGTYLPQVIKETGWNAEEFLGHCSAEKAGLGWDGWKTADLYTYEAIVFSEGTFHN